jgi:hypothetical protein
MQRLRGSSKKRRANRHCVRFGMRARMRRHNERVRVHNSNPSDCPGKDITQVRQQTDETVLTLAPTVTDCHSESPRIEGDQKHSAPDSGGKYRESSYKNNVIAITQGSSLARLLLFRALGLQTDHFRGGGRAGLRSSFGFTLSSLCFLWGVESIRFRTSSMDGCGASSLTGGLLLDMLKDYYTALGEFVDEFAKTENFIFWTLHVVSGIETPVFNALLSGTRARAAISYLRRIAETRDTELPQWLTDAFGQFGTINTERDLILHSGVTPTIGLALLVSNKDRAHVSRSARTIPVSAEVLERMTNDLQKISKLLSIWLMTDEIASLRAMFPSPKIKVSVAPDALEHVLRKSWLYKSPQPESKDRKSPPATPKPSRQRKPSPE